MAGLVSTLSVDPLRMRERRRPRATRRRRPLPMPWSVAGSRSGPPTTSSVRSWRWPKTRGSGLTRCRVRGSASPSGASGEPSAAALAADPGSGRRDPGSGCLPRGCPLLDRCDRRDRAGSCGRGPRGGEGTPRPDLTRALSAGRVPSVDAGRGNDREGTQGVAARPPRRRLATDHGDRACAGDRLRRSADHGSRRAWPALS